MKKILIAYGVLLIVIALLAFAKFNGSNFLPNFSSSPTAEINKHKVNVKVARTIDEKKKGLSKIKTLKESDGMVFPFDTSAKYPFWMRDVEFPLDIIYIQNDTIVDIIKNAQPQAGKDVSQIPVLTPKADANFVLEVVGGYTDKYKIKIGDKVKFTGVNK